MAQHLPSSDTHSDAAGEKPRAHVGLTQRARMRLQQCAAERGADAHAGLVASTGAPLRLWCWQWDDLNWRGSFFFFSGMA